MIARSIRLKTEVIPTTLREGLLRNRRLSLQAACVFRNFACSYLAYIGSQVLSWMDENAEDLEKQEDKTTEHQQQQLTTTNDDTTKNKQWVSTKRWQNNINNNNQ